MNILKFSNYNESLDTTVTYNDIVVKFSKINKDDIEDRYLEVTDLGVLITSIDILITDEKGSKIMGDNLENNSSKFYLSYCINLRYDVDCTRERALYINLEKRSKEYKKHLEINDLILSISYQEQMDY